MDFSPPPIPDQPILLAEMEVQFIVDNRLISAPGRVFQRLWPSPWVIIEVSGVTRDLQPSPSSMASKEDLSIPLASVGPSSVQLENGTRVEVVSIPWLFGQEDAVLHLKKSPYTVFESGEAISNLHIDVLNITGDLFRLPLNLEAPPWLVKVEPVQGLKDLERGLRPNGGYAVTHNVTVQRLDGMTVSKNDAENILRGIDHFLSFVCGSRCATANVVGFDSRGKEAWKRWGCHRVSSWRLRRSWCDITIREALSEVFSEFWQNYLRTSKHLDRVLGWYVLSNESEAQDLSIVLNQTVLEIFTTLMASGKSKEHAMGERIANVLCRQGIDPQVPAQCSELKALASKNGFEHGPHTLVKIRNSIVHSFSDIEDLSNDSYREATQLGLWYIELLLLKMFKYTGEYASRLTDVQRAGATEPVPWANGVHIQP